MSNPKILMVLDRLPYQGSFGLSFSVTPDPTDNSYFSISHLLSKLNANITKAHRQTDPASDNGAPTPADIENFQFTSASLSGFDEVWLIGYNSTRPDSAVNPAEKASVLNQGELAALTTFMNNGGGVFAVGDHAGLGLSLSGNVPRVRSMRKWWYPTLGPFNEPIAPEPVDMNGRMRLDTTRPGHGIATDPNNPNVFAVFFDDQSDDIPQYISPVNTPNLCYEPIVYETNPDLLHPLLQGPRGPILAFADHMHEGEVVMPYEYDRVFTFNGQQFPEYPSGTKGQVHPQIVAWSWTNGAANVVPPTEQGVHVGDDNISPFNFFGAVGAYDGSLVNVGRVVVESTFHHFLDINLIGDPAAPQGDKQKGFLASAQGQAILADIEQYYNNVAVWLAPPHFGPKKWVGAAIAAIQIQPLRDIAGYPSRGAIEDFGKIAVDSLKTSVRPGMLITWLKSILPDSVSAALPALPWGPVTGTSGCGSVNYRTLLYAAMGGAVIAAERIRRQKGTGVLSEDHAQQEIIKASLEGLTTLSNDLARRGEGLVRLADALRSIHAVR